MCGSNRYGELGTGSNEATKKPVKIMTDVESVDACYYNTAIIKKDGTLLTCGFNDCGQLGCNTNESLNKPAIIAKSVKMASFGAGHLLILKNDGSVWACGAGGRGALGNNDWENKLIPVKVMTGVKSISAGNEYSAFIKKDNTLWTCGYNQHSQLGDGTTNDRYIPVQIATNVTDVVASESTLILKEDGSLWMCGEANYLESSGYSVYSKPVMLFGKGFGKSHISGVKISSYNSLPNAFQEYYIGFKSSVWSDKVYVMLFDIEDLKSTTKILGESFLSINDGNIIHDIIYHYRYDGWYLNGSQIGFGSIPISKILFSNIDIYDAQGNIIFKANTPGTVEKKSIAMNKSTVSLNIGDSTTLKVTMTGITGNTSWSSSNKDVATVSSSGKVTAKKAGTATITAKVGSYNATCKVTVSIPKVNNKRSEVKITSKINGHVLSSKYCDSFFDSYSTKTTCVTENNALLQISALGAASTYSCTSISTKKFLEKCGFNYNKKFTGSGKSSSLNNNDNCIIYTGEKRVNVLSPTAESKRTIAIVVSGYSKNGYEWISNFNIGLGDVHSGFSKAADKVIKYIDSEYKPRKNDIIWIMGHSRGAAITNLVADHYITNGFKNIYAYGFATPNVSTKTRKTKRILNIINSGDFVPYVPLSNWGYSKNGTNRMFTMNSNMKELFKDIRFPNMRTGEDMSEIETELFNKICNGSKNGYFVTVKPSSIQGIKLISPKLYMQSGVALLMNGKESVINTGYTLMVGYSVYSHSYAYLTAHLALNQVVNPKIIDAHCMETYLAIVNGAIPSV